MPSSIIRQVQHPLFNWDATLAVHGPGKVQVPEDRVYNHYELRKLAEFPQPKRQHTFARVQPCEGRQTIASDLKRMNLRKVP